jgi:hypothetical protein
VKLEKSENLNWDNFGPQTIEEKIFAVKSLSSHPPLHFPIFRFTYTLSHQHASSKFINTACIEVH